MARIGNLTDNRGEKTTFKPGDVLTWDARQNCFTFSRANGDAIEALKLDGDNKLEMRGLENPEDALWLMLAGRNLDYKREMDNPIGYNRYTLIAA